MKWLKMWTEARNDGKLRCLSDRQHRVWFRLLCFAAEQDPPGTVRASWKILAAECADGQTETVQDAVTEMESLQLVSLVTCNDKEVEIVFPSFARRQVKYPSEDPKRVNARVRKHRGERRLRQSGADETTCNELKRAETAQKKSINTPLNPPTGGRSIRSFVPPDWVPRDAWDAWVEHRSKGRAKPTLRALELAVGRLATLRDEGSDPGAVLTQSVVNGWSGLFAVKDVGGRPPAPALKPPEKIEYYDHAKELERMRNSQ